MTLSGEWGVREDVDDRNQCQIGRLIRRKEGWCMGVGPGVRERERVGPLSINTTDNGKVTFLCQSDTHLYMMYSEPFK